MDATLAVTAVREVGSDTVAIVLESPPGFEASPGQFVRLSGTVDGETYARFYTLSSPDTASTFEVTVGVDPDEAGPFSRHLAALEPGDELEVAGPFGDAYYGGERRAVVLAGGPGVGPAVGIAERALAEGNAAAVVYVAAAPAHTERLDALRERGVTVHVTDGAIEDVVADVVTGDPDEAVFVYGFAAFVEEAAAALTAAGVDPDGPNVNVESFG
jgi:ferredoxin-NADP reductase